VDLSGWRPPPISPYPQDGGGVEALRAYAEADQVVGDQNPTVGTLVTSLLELEVNEWPLHKRHRGKSQCQQHADATP
jgi:hypothetical protein